MSVNPLDIFANKPVISKHSVSVEEDFIAHYRHDLPGELEVAEGLTHHLITFFLTENKRQTTHFDCYGEYDGQMRKGEFYLCPAEVPGFTSWQAVGATPEDVVKITILSVDHNEEKLRLISAERNSFWSNHKPASTLIPVPRLASEEMLFEIDAVAVIPNS